MINIGVVGLGGMGRHQAHSFAQVPGCRVVAGSDPSEDSRAQFTAAHPDAATYTDHRDLLADKKVDAVVVVTPTLYHKDVAIEAMKSGRPVLTEKPLARSVGDAHRMIEASERSGKLLMVAHCRRFDTDWGAFAKIFRSGILGGPVIWRHCNANKITFGGPWFMDDKLSGGPLMDGAVHNYDFGNLLFGDPESVLASSIKLTDKTAIDTGTAVVQYKSGHQIMVNWSWGVTSQSLIDVMGPKGSLTFGAGDLATPDLDTKAYGYYMTADPLRQKKKLHRFKRTDMYVTQAKHFLACLDGKAECLSPATEAIKAVGVAEAILKAAPTGAVRRVTW